MNTLYPFPLDDNTPKKICKGPCGQEHPATTEFWHAQKGGKYGLNATCKECKSLRRRKVKTLIADDIPVKYKQCTGPCGLILPSTCFHRNRSRKDTLAYQCKACSAQYKKDNKISAKSKPPQAPVLKGHKRCTGPCKKEYLATTEFFYQCQTSKGGLSTQCKVCALKKSKDRQRLPEARKRIRAYRSRPAVQVKYNVYGRNRRARQKSVKGSYALDQIQDQLKRQKHKCYYCHEKFQKVKGKYIYHVEHTFPLSRVAGTDIPANSIDYLVLACPTCNMRKGNKFPWEFPEGGRLL